MNRDPASLAAKKAEKPSRTSHEQSPDSGIDRYGAGALPEFLSDNYFETPNSNYAGISPKEATRIFKEWTGVDLASNSLYLIEISDISGSNASPEEFQMFTTSISYSPITIPAEKQNIGSAVIDGVKLTEHVDMNLTTYDDKKGTIKRWLDNKAGQIAKPDGTVGIPIDYLVRVRVLHAFFSDETNNGGYEVKYLMRPVSVEHSIGRAEGGKQELQIVLTQFDTFMSA